MGLVLLQERKIRPRSSAPPPFIMLKILLKAEVWPWDSDAGLPLNLNQFSLLPDDLATYFNGNHYSRIVATQYIRTLIHGPFQKYPNF